MSSTFPFRPERFLANENFPAPSTGHLRFHGFDVLSIQESYRSIRDITVIELAKLENRIILTFDKDYGEMIYRYGVGTPPSVVFFRSKGKAPNEAGKILRSLLENGEISLNGAFTIVSGESIRQRKYDQPS
jgi:predicted nuclease of predicted toxin-antitoxin system